MDAPAEKLTEKLNEAGSLVDRLVVAIRDAIISGELAPGAPVRVKRIADAHGVSMIPVREALARLLASRLVRVEPNRGYFVADKPTPQEFAQFVQFREAFEISAVSMGFDNATPADLRALRRLNAKMRRVAAGPPADAMIAWGKLNAEFHRVLVGLAGNVFISAQYETLSLGHMHYQLAQAYEIEFTSLGLLADQHDGLIEALASGDKPLFLSRMSAHINNLRLGGDEHAPTA